MVSQLPVYKQKIVPKNAAIRKFTYEEGDEDGGVHHDQGQDGSPAVADAVGNGTSEEDTDESATLTRLEQGTLPFRLDGFSCSVGVGHTISVLEGSQGDKVGVQEHVEGFHDLCMREQKDWSV